MKKLTRKQEAFVKHLVDNPKASATEAAAQTYGKPDKVMSRHMAEVIASTNMRKDEIRTELAKYSQVVENTLYNTVQDWGNHQKPRQREIAQQAAMYIHDKVHGKATQRIEQQSVSVNIDIDLS